MAAGLLHAKNAELALQNGLKAPAPSPGVSAALSPNPTARTST